MKVAGWCAVWVAAALVAYAVPDLPAATVGTITVGPAADGGQRRLGPGDVLVVRLPSNPSTGYAWSVRAGPGRVLARAGRTYLPPKEPRRLGAPGTAVLRFHAAAPGRTMLRLAYVRSWQQGAPPARTFSLRVTVS